MIHISNCYYFRQKCDPVFSEKISRVFYQTCESICAKLSRTCFKNLKCAPTAEFLIREIFDHTKYGTTINSSDLYIVFFSLLFSTNVKCIF